MHQYRTFKLWLLIFSLSFLAFNSVAITVLTFIFINILLAMLTIITAESSTQKIISIVSYSCLLPVQICYAVFVIRYDWPHTAQDIFFNSIIYLLLIFSFSLENYIEMKNYHHYFFHTTDNVDILPFSDLQKFTHIIKKQGSLINKASTIMTKDNIAQVIHDMNRTSSFEYINNGTLSSWYLQMLDRSLEDSSVYIVLSDTGSAQSQMISLFTEKPYNHVSISFDRELHTLVSYNGGERINPPGLNSEMLSFLAKKKNAVVYVYSLPVTKQQKLMMIEKIKEINQNGSAYNLLGLVLKKSFKPNIMYCSQFVYTLLEYAGANYFTKNPHNIRPTDLVELDYYKKLNFEFEIKVK